MKKGINFWSFPEGTTISQALQLANDNGFEGIELVFNEHGELSLDSSDDELLAIRAQVEQSNVELVGLATALYWQYPLCDNSPAVVQKAKNITQKLIYAAKVLGCDSVLVVPGVVQENLPYHVAYDRALEACLELKQYAEESRIHVCLENVWNKFLLSPLEFRNFVDSIGSEYVQVYFDAGNVQQMGFPAHWVQVLQHRIKRVHIKDFRNSVGNIQGFVDLLSGDVNFPAVMQALKDTNYDGWITAEVCPAYQYHPEQSVCNISHSMDRILGRSIK